MNNCCEKLDTSRLTIAIAIRVIFATYFVVYILSDMTEKYMPRKFAKIRMATKIAAKSNCHVVYNVK